MTYYEEIMLDTPRAWYRFEPQGSNIITNAMDLFDLSGNGRDGTYQAASGFPHQIVPGPFKTSEIGTAIKRAPGSSVSSGFATVPTSASPLPVGNDTGSLEVWIKTSNLPSGGTSILGGWGSSGASSSMVLNINTTFTIGFWVYVSAASGGAEYLRPSVDFAPYVDDEWHHIVGTFDRGVIKLYIDGQMVSTITRTTGTPPFRIYNGGNVCYVGRYSSHTQTQYGWPGEMAEAAVYDQALSEERILAHYLAAFPSVDKALQWDLTPERIYDAGVSNGVLYPSKTQNGVVWNGLISVTENVSGGSVESYYRDGNKYLDVITNEDYQATIEAYGSPLEFAECDGQRQLAPGLFATRQPRLPFGFSYRTLVGNPVEGTDLGYKIHLVYNCMAAPAQRKNSTMTDAPSPTTMSWTVNSVPPSANTYKPTAHLVIDSRFADPQQLYILERALYGTDQSYPRLPPQSEVISILEG